MPFPKGGNHTPETREKISEGVTRHIERVRRDTLVTTGVGRSREPAPARDRDTFSRPRDQE